jgi:hypothetical protein
MHVEEGAWQVRLQGFEDASNGSFPLAISSDSRNPLAFLPCVAYVLVSHFVKNRTANLSSHVIRTFFPLTFSLLRKPETRPLTPWQNQRRRRRLTHAHHQKKRGSMIANTTLSLIFYLLVVFRSI